jgi:hypothetical protein
MNLKNWGKSKDGGTCNDWRFSQSKLTDQTLTFSKHLK